VLAFVIAMPLERYIDSSQRHDVHRNFDAAANRTMITFRDNRGAVRRYAVREVDTVRFGDGPYRSSVYPQPGYGNGPGYGNRPGNGNQGSGYDQDRMERVVIPAGTELGVTTNQRIDARDAVAGQTFSAQIAEDVRDTDGSIAIPRGSDANLVARRLEANGDITLDVESIVVAGRRYRVSTTDQELQNRRAGIGANARTGQFVGGGAVLGAIIGAIAGGGKGAAIGAGVGAGAGAGTQIVTRGREVHVPAETVIRFRLDLPLVLRFWS
jgi:hypothetical protein